MHLTIERGDSSPLSSNFNKQQKKRIKNRATNSCLHQIKDMF